VPIRIWIEPDGRFGLLRPGLSATVSISHGPGDVEWAVKAARQEALTAGITEPSP
jgi:membrane fusion protein (multidrug efflux system)